MDLLGTSVRGPANRRSPFVWVAEGVQGTPTPGIAAGLDYSGIS